MKTNTPFLRSATVRFCLLGLTAIIGSLGTISGIAAEPQLSEPAKALHAKLASKLKPAVREWVFQEAAKTASDPAKSEAAVRADIGRRFSGQGLADGDIEALVFIVMMEAAKSAQEDLKATMAEVNAANQKKAALRAKAGKPSKVETNSNAAAQPVPPPRVTTAQARPVPPGPKKGPAAGPATPSENLDSQSEMGETESLRLQMAMDRRAKLLETISNVMKKTSETSSAIIGNLK